MGNLFHSLLQHFSGSSAPGSLTLLALLQFWSFPLQSFLIQSFSLKRGLHEADGLQAGFLSRALLGPLQVSASAILSRRFLRAMDCCLCDQSPHLFRPRNSICMSCFEGAKDILEFASRLDLEDEAEAEVKTSPSHSDSLKADRRSPSKTFSKPLQGKGLADAIKHIKQLEQAVGTASKQINYLGAMGAAFVEGFHADLELATDDDHSIRVHKVILAARSSVFRTMLEMDSYKDAKNSRVRIPEITHVELKHLVEFMYTGQLTLEALQDHSPGLMLAADKYDIPLLIEICEAYLIDTMSTQNALEVLEVATRLSAATALKEAAMGTIVHNSESILFSREYEEFALKNPLLAVRVSQAVMQQLKSRLFSKPVST